MDQVAIKAEVGSVYHWLGIGSGTWGYPPEGLHGLQRKRITLRHTREIRSKGGAFAEAIASTYPPSREVHVMLLLRPQHLDDTLWRKVYALMVTGGPIWQWDLVRSLARLTSTRRVMWTPPGGDGSFAMLKPVADIEALRLYMLWLNITKAPHP